jgi:hypothetical protein
VPELRGRTSESRSMDGSSILLLRPVCLVVLDSATIRLLSWQWLVLRRRWRRRVRSIIFMQMSLLQLVHNLSSWKNHMLRVHSCLPNDRNCYAPRHPREPQARLGCSSRCGFGSRGLLLKADDSYTPGAILKKWDQISNFKDAEYPTGVADFMGLLERSMKMSPNDKGETLDFKGKVALVTGGGAG